MYKTLGNKWLNEYSLLITMKKDFKVGRFGVRISNKYSKIYRIWLNKKGDIYLSLRNIASRLKVSFHISGSWQISLTTEQYKNDKLNLDNRHIKLWNKPEGNYGEMTLAFRILIPHSELKENQKHTEKKINWIESENKNDATEIVIIFVKPNAKITHWPGFKKNTKLLYKFPIKNDEIVYLVYKEFNFTKEGKLTLLRYKNRFNSWAKDNSKGNYGALLFGDENDGSKKIYDINIEK